MSFYIFLLFVKFRYFENFIWSLVHVFDYLERMHKTTTIIINFMQLSIAFGVREKFMLQQRS